jgi:ACT domain-containing protein
MFVYYLMNKCSQLLNFEFKNKRIKMKNTIKMSLVAAVAVAGLSSTVSAQPLTEAIKNVDISGSVLYRYNDYSYDNKGSDTENYYKVATSLKSKVNDYVTATVRVVAASATGGIVKLDTSANNDSNVAVSVSHANFTVKTDAATVIAGKQGLTTPWTVALDNDGDEQTGTGILALIPAGPVTVAAAYFNQTNLTATGSVLNKAGITTTEANIATLGLMAQAGPVALDAWYLNLSDVLDTYTVGAKTTIEGITADLRYTSVDFEDAIMTTDNSLLNLKISSKVGPVAVWGQYAMTDKDGGTTALENSAKTSVEGWNVTSNGKADMDLFGIGASMDVMSGLNVALNYRTLDYANNSEESELYTQITHKMGKNLITYVRLGQYDKDLTGTTNDVDSFRGRLQVEYKF